jgi:hypothetical protein
MSKNMAALALALLPLAGCGAPTPPLTPEQSFLKAAHAALDGKVTLYDDKLVSAGQMACGLIPTPGVTHSRIVAAAAQGLMTNNIPDPFGTAEVLITSAERNLCPTVHYAKAEEAS